MCLLCFLFAATAAKSQQSFTVSVSANQVYKNDAVQVEYKITNALDTKDFVAPVFSGWNVLSGPSYAQEESYINGRSERFTSYIYVLMPTQAGRLQVPGTSVTCDGRKLTCKGITVTVLNKTNPSQARTPPPPSMQLQSLFGDDNLDDAFLRDPVLRQGERPDQKIRDNIFVKAVVSKSTCYAGEPILVTYKLYTALKTQPKVTRQPAFTGCSVTEMTTDENLPSEKINGKTYQVYLVRKVQLVPLQPGNLTLDTASVQNEVSFAIPEQQYALQSYMAVLSSKPITIHVKPLPEKNKPAAFSGIIGQFAIRAEARKPELPSGENDKLLVSIEGHGNIVNVNAPAVTWPAGIDHFEPVQHENIDKMNYPIKGVKTFEIPFIGTKEGNFTVPPVRFTYFDPEKETYEEIHTDSIPLHFTKAVKHSLKDDPAIITEDFTTRHYIWIVPAIAAVVGIAWWLLALRDKKHKKQPARPATNNTPAATSPAGALATAVTPAPAETVLMPKTDFPAAIDMLTQMDDNQLFYAKVKQLLTQALQEALAVKSATPEQLLPLLRQKENAETLAIQCHTLYAQCDLALYAPALSEGNREQVREHLKQITVQLAQLN